MTRDKYLGHVLTVVGLRGLADEFQKLEDKRAGERRVMQLRESMGSPARVVGDRLSVRHPIKSRVKPRSQQT